MKNNLSGTLAIDLGNTNTVVAFQGQKDINSILVEIPNITSSPGVDVILGISTKTEFVSF